MPHQTSVVLSSAAPCDPLPAYAAEAILLCRYALLAEELPATEKLGALRRSDAASLPMVLAFLITYFCAGSQPNGLRGLATDHRGTLTKIAASLGLAKLPSSGAISTFLSSMPLAQANAVAGALLAHSVHGSVLHNHSLTTLVDRLDQAYILIDIDPTVQAERKRALPQGEDLPQPRRRTDGFATPGYPGRHRGEVIFSACRTQATGTGLWSAISVQAGNTALAPALKHAMAQSEPQMRPAGLPKLLVIVRIDGAGGNVPCLRQLVRAGVLYVVRSAHYTILQHSDVYSYLQDGSWQDVEDSGSGPKREALDLGRWPWNSTSESKDAAPITPRMVATRFRSADPETRHGAGWLDDGWHYELFATPLEGPAWPANDVASLYFGRACLENRFAQENRELGLDRVFSYTLAGQLLATAVGMYVWNRRVCLGAELAEIQAAPVLQTALLPSAEPAVPPEHLAGESDPAVAPVSDAAGAMPQTQPCQTAVEQTEPLPPPSLTADDVLKMNWQAALLDRPGFEQIDTGLRCPAGSTLHVRPTKISVSPTGDIHLALRAPKSACRNCPKRSDCSTSAHPLFRKEIALVLRQTPVPAPNTNTHPASKAATQWHPPAAPAPALGTLRLPQLIPVELMRLWTKAVHAVELRVTIAAPPPPPKPPAYIAATAAQRQRRRHTWTERTQRHALDEKTQVSMDLRGAHGLRSQIQRLFSAVSVQ